MSAASGDSASHYETAIANGFDWSAVGAPVVIGGGLRGNRFAPVTVDLQHFREVEIAPEIVDADAIVGITHFKGHEISGFGGTLKNFGMGCASRHGKLSMHSTTNPRVKAETCTACHSCIRWCAFGAIRASGEDRKASIDPERCSGCGACLPTCPVGAIQIDLPGSSRHAGADGRVRLRRNGSRSATARSLSTCCCRFHRCATAIPLPTRR